MTVRDAEIARLLATARWWDEKHRADLALEFVDKADMLAPGTPRILLERGLIELRSNRTAAALSTLRRLQGLAPDAEPTLDLADAYRLATRDRHQMVALHALVRTGHAEEARRRLQQLFPRGAPRGPVAFDYFSVLSASPAGKPEAVAGLRAVLRREPENADAALALAGLLVDHDATRREGMRLAQHVATQSPEHHQRALDLWRGALLAAGDDTSYVDEYAAYLAQAPDDQTAAARMTSLTAARAAQARREADPAWQAQRAGLALLARDDTAAAEPLLMRALVTRGDDAPLLGGLGVLRMRQGRHAEARALFLRAAQHDASGRAKWRDLARTANFWDTLARGREAAAQGRPDDAETLARSALAQQPGQRQARSMLVDALLAQGRWQAAEPILRAMLAEPQPDLSAVEQTGVLLRATGRAAEIEPMLAALAPRLPGDARARLDSLRAAELTRTAQAQLAEGKNGPAVDELERAVRLAPDAAWTRYALAGTYRRLGLPQLGRTVMDEGLRVTQTPDMRYATALYRASLDNTGGALAALEPVPEALRTAGMLRLSSALHAQRLIDTALAQRAAGDTVGSARSLHAAAALVPDDAPMLADIGSAWIDGGDAATGLALVRGWLDRHPGGEATDARLRYGDLLAHAGRDDELGPWLGRVFASGPLTDAQRARLADQSLRLALRRTDTAIAASAFDTAQQTLQAVDAQGQADPRWALELADLRRAEGRYVEARAAIERVLARTPDDAQARLALARILEDSGQRQAARALVADVAAQAADDDVDTRLSAARRLVALRRPDQAAALTDALRAHYPTRADVTLQAGRAAQAQGHFDEAASLYALARTQEIAAAQGQGGRMADGDGDSTGNGNGDSNGNSTPAQQAADALHALRQGQVASAWRPSFKRGDAGVSRLVSNEAPVYVRLSDGNRGDFFFHADSVALDAGTLDVGNIALRGTFGGFAAAPAVTQDTLRAGLTQRAVGVALAAGYEADAWRADLGTTPLGFAVEDVVGGLRYAFATDDANFSVNLSRRADTSTLLSYAGTRDPVTGEVWGGVRRDGLDLHAAASAGRFDFFVDVGAALFTGRNVASNSAATLRTGFEFPLLARTDMRVTSGLTGSAWHYARNLRYYTFGQGGYYSPQRYLALSVPLQWQGRADRFSWQLAGSVGRSNTYESASDFFPTDARLQGAAQAAAALGASGARYAASSGGGLSYAVSGAIEFRVTPHLIAGAAFSLDRSHDYAPSRASLYARYMFDAQKGSVPFPPSPVRPYSSY